MFRFAVLALALVAATNASVLDAGSPAMGGIKEGTVTPETLQNVLAQTNFDSKVKSIDRVRVQVVAGIRYLVDYTTEDDKKCTATWVDAQWKNPKIQNVQASCK